jgi:hypothetical protein
MSDGSFKDLLMKRGVKLMSDPRVLKWMQDPRFMKTLMQVMAMPGKVQSLTRDQVEKFARAMALATEDEVRDLRRTVRRLEEEMARIQRSQEDARANGKREGSPP